MKHNILICPKCKQEIFINNKTASCLNNHSFDISKEGYINFLLANQKNSKNPGDDKIMINSRNDFLNKGYFQNLSDEIVNIIKEYKNDNILDAGCGTGYYINNIQKNLTNQNFIGIDISKEAIKKASKLNKNILFLVASIYDMPIKNESIDIILNTFAPKPLDEIYRILKMNGIVIEVIPGKNHLIELKELIYNENTKENIEKYALNNLCLKDTKRLTYQKEILNNIDLQNLFKMTPYFYKTKEEEKQNINNIKNINITFDFIINIWIKQY